MRAIAKVEAEAVAKAEMVNLTTPKAEAEVVAGAEAVEAVVEVEVEEGGNICSSEGLRVYTMSTRRGLAGRVFLFYYVNDIHRAYRGLSGGDEMPAFT